MVVCIYTALFTHPLSPVKINRTEVHMKIFLTLYFLTIDDGEFELLCWAKREKCGHVPSSGYVPNIFTDQSTCYQLKKKGLHICTANGITLYMGFTPMIYTEHKTSICPREIFMVVIM